MVRYGPEHGEAAPAVERSARRARETVRSHRDLVAWKQAYALGLELYAITRGFPASEAFGLTGQLRRAAIGVPSNIAEGRARDSKRDFVRFLRIAAGSLAEIDTQVRFAADLGYIAPGQCGILLHQIEECRRLIGSLISSLKRSLASERKSTSPAKPTSAASGLSKRSTGRNPPPRSADPRPPTASPIPDS